LLGKARSGIVSGTVIVLISVLLAGGIIGFVRSPEWQRRYHQWRLLKPNASEVDRFRSREFLEEQLRRAVGTTNTAPAFEKLYAPLLKPLRYRSVPLKQVDELQQFIFYSRVPQADVYVIPQLIEVLRTDNLDVRTRVQRLLSEIQQASYPNAPAPAWQPKKEDSLHFVDEKIREWQNWWKQVNGTRP
jgi:hypothetical protein